MNTHLILHPQRQRFRAFPNFAAPFERWLGRRLPASHRAIISSIMRRRYAPNGIRVIISAPLDDALQQTLIAFLGYMSSRHPGHPSVIADLTKPLAEAHAHTLRRLLGRRKARSPQYIITTSPTRPFSVRGSTFNNVLVLNSHRVSDPRHCTGTRLKRWSNLMTSLLGPPMGPSSMIIVQTAKPPPGAIPLVRHHLGPAFIDADTDPQSATILNLADPAQPATVPIPTEGIPFNGYLAHLRHWSSQQSQNSAFSILNSALDPSPVPAKR